MAQGLGPRPRSLRVGLGPWDWRLDLARLLLCVAWPKSCVAQLYNSSVELQHTLTDAGGYVRAVAFCHDSSLLATGSGGDTFIYSVQVHHPTTEPTSAPTVGGGKLKCHFLHYLLILFYFFKKRR